MSYPYPYIQQRAIPTNESAVASLVFSLIGAVLAVLSLAVIPLLILAFLFEVIAIIAGHVAKRGIRLSGQRGDGLATAGLIIGYLGVIPGVIMMIVFIGTMIAISV